MIHEIELLKGQYNDMITREITYIDECIHYINEHNDIYFIYIEDNEDYVIKNKVNDTKEVFINDIKWLVEKTFFNDIEFLMSHRWDKYYEFKNRLTELRMKTELFVKLNTNFKQKNNHEKKEKI